jgi:hypothetical protein
VTPEDIQRVANKYFAPENRNVAIYTRKQGLPTLDDPELAAMDPAIRQQLIMPALSMINSKDDPAELEMIYSQMSASLPMMEARQAEMPPGAIDGFKYVLKKLRERIDSLQPATDENE